MLRYSRALPFATWKWSKTAASFSRFPGCRELSTETVVKIHSAIAEGCCLEYSKSWAWQHVLLSRRLASRRNPDDNDAVVVKSAHDSECVLLLEHSPVYTLGRGADETHLTFLEENRKDHDEIRRKLSRKVRGPGTARLSVDRSCDDPYFDLPLHQAVEQLVHSASPVMTPNGVPIYRVERGGEVTFHGPSQLVVYPMFDLQKSPFVKDLHWYLRMIEEVIIRTLQRYDIEGKRDNENTGVWVGEDKVAAVGISSSRWITTHGFAINVDPNLKYFDTSLILPCGIEGKGVTSMAKILRSRGDQVPSIQEVADETLQSMAAVFGIRFEDGDPIR